MDKYHGAGYLLKEMDIRKEFRKYLLKTSFLRKIFIFLIMKNTKQKD
jgi:hypothetical protein